MSNKRLLFDWEVRIIRRTRRKKLLPHITKKHPHSVESLANRFGVSKNTISNIANGHSYADVSDKPTIDDFDRPGERAMADYGYRGWTEATELDTEMAPTAFLKGERA